MVARTSRTKPRVVTVKGRSPAKGKPNRHELTCASIMTREVITVSPDATLSELCRMLAEDEISGAPVVDHRGQLVGMVSKTDVLQNLLSGRQSPGLPSATLQFLGLSDTMAGMAEDGEEEAFGQVADFMTPDVESVTPATPIARAARRMSAKRIHRLVVVDNGEVVGIITSLDLLKHFGR